MGGMKEKLARVLCDRWGIPWELAVDNPKAILGSDMAYEYIDAILDAMREPSEEMCDCGIDTQNYWADATPESVWQAMIDAIKAGK